MDLGPSSSYPNKNQWESPRLPPLQRKFGQLMYQTQQKMPPKKRRFHSHGATRGTSIKDHWVTPGWLKTGLVEKIITSILRFLFLRRGFPTGVPFCVETAWPMLAHQPGSSEGEPGKSMLLACYTHTGPLSLTELWQFGQQKALLQLACKHPVLTVWLLRIWIGVPYMWRSSYANNATPCHWVFNHIQRCIVHHTHHSLFVNTHH